MIYNFGSGFTPIYTDTDGTQHTVDEFKVVGGGLDKWIKGLARDSALGWDEASFGASPSRSTTAPFSMTNIDNIEFGQVAQFEATMPMMTIADFRDLQTVLHQRYFYVTFFNVQTLKWITREMMVTNNERERLYMRIGYGMIGTQGYRTPTIYGMQSVKVKFVATNRNLAEYDEAVTITYEFNGGTLVTDEKQSKYDIGDQAQVYGRNDVSKGTEVLQYWRIYKDGGTVVGGVLFPAQRFTIFESLTLAAVWGEEENLEFVNIGYSLSGVHDVSALPRTMLKNSTITVTLAPDVGYELPNRVVVGDNVTSKWNKATGELTLSNPTSDFTVTVVGVEKAEGGGDVSTAVSVDYTLNKVIRVAPLVDSMRKDEIASIALAPNEGYALPDNVSVSDNVTSEWHKIDGELILSNPTADVKIAVDGVASAVPTNTKLLGTTWVFFKRLTTADIPSFPVGFTSNGTEYISINKLEGGTGIGYRGNNFLAAAYSVSSGWSNTAYREITITDVARLGDRTDFAKWLSVNGTQKSSIELLGTWVLWETIDVANAPTAALEFVTDNTTFAEMRKVDGENTLAYGATNVYKNGGWEKQEYRVITITKIPTNLSEFHSWLVLNADKATTAKVAGDMVVAPDASVADTTATINNGSVSGTTLTIN